MGAIAGVWHAAGGGAAPALALIALLGASAALSALLLRALQPLLARYALARPNARSSHRRPTPQGGGIAVIAATLLVALGAALGAPQAVAEPARMATLLAACVALAGLGAVDDIRPLPVWPRLLLQAAAVLVAMAALPPLRLVPWLPLWGERALLFLAMLWFVNLVNFMDGIDWITVAETVPLTAALALCGLIGVLPGEVALVALALCGAMIGFAPFNRPVARIFLGDVGSLPIGLLLAWMLASLAAHGHLAAALLMPLYYLADATVTLSRRLIAGEAVFEAHRGHFYQRALDGGMDVYAIVGRIFLLNLALIGLAGATLLVASRLLHAAALAAGCLLVGLTLRRFAHAKR